MRQCDHDGGMFFGYLYDVIIRSHAPIFWLAVFLDSRAEYAFLELLIEFLAFLVQTLGQKTANCQEVFLNTFEGFPQIILSFFALIVEPETLKTRSDPSKSRVVTKKQLN